MLGVFDSGRGGRNALAALQKIAPHADIVFFADTDNAPYGTKSAEELCRLIVRDITLLRKAGASEILMACCTASCLHARLPDALRRNTFPILEPTATAAVGVSQAHRYAVLATEATVRSGQFKARLRERVPQAQVLSLAAPQLVTLAECERTSREDPEVRRVLAPLCERIAAFAADTVLLGCTHFSPFAAAVRHLLPGVHVIGSAEEGAQAFAASLPASSLSGNGNVFELYANGALQKYT